MRDILKNLGIEYFGFTDASLLRAANERLYSRMPKDARVVFMLIPYYCGDCNGSISAYGAVYDYHIFAKELFAHLEGYMNEKYPHDFSKGFADHSPYLECEGAALSSLGILGENSLLICEKYSSFVFIASLVTTLSREALIAEGIPEGKGEIKRCEGCSLCKNACPTGAVLSTGRENCISALTQKKGELSKEETDLVKNSGSIWGCDACQRACPHTRAAFENNTIYTPIEFFRRSYIGDGAGEKIKNMDKDTFSRYPFAWRKRATIERNIEIIDSDSFEKGEGQND